MFGDPRITLPIPDKKDDMHKLLSEANKVKSKNDCVMVWDILVIDNNLFYINGKWRKRVNLSSPDTLREPASDTWYG